MKTESKKTNQPKFETRAIHAGQDPDPTTNAVMYPIYMTTTYAQSSPGVHKGYDYSRAGNPTRTAYEKCLASLEGGKYGFAFASGCAASTTVSGLLKEGDHVVVCDDVYGGTRRLFSMVLDDKGLDFTFVDMTDFKKFESAIKKNTKLVWMETPTNPTMKILDVKKITTFCQKKKILTLLDNSFMSPYFQRPLDLGVDIAYHSTTKYIGGHSDILGGALITSDDKLGERIQYLQKCMGTVPSPFDCFMAMRSIKTLAVRMKQHEENAKALAGFLEKQPKIEKVLYPGLKSHPQHELAKKQMSGFGGMLSFYIKGGLKETKRFLENLQVFTLAESLGGVESLMNHPAIMTHASVPVDVRRQLGITDNLIRVSVGIEHVDDLIDDLKSALAKA